MSILNKLDKEQKELWAALNEYKAIIEYSEQSLFKKFILALKPKAVKKCKGGFYVYGAPGRGKTVLLNLFADSLNVKTWKVHFHDFMLYCHNKLHEIRSLSEVSAESAIDKLIKEITQNYKAIFLDEMQINNIADAMIIERIFKFLNYNGTYIFCSSNAVPSELYKNGLQRDRFLPFIDFLNDKLEVVRLAYNKDYRVLESPKLEQSYYYPLNKENTEIIESWVEKVTKGTEPISASIETSQQRYLNINNSYENLAVMSFNEICDQPLWAEDYRSICKKYKIIVLMNIPQMQESDSEQIARFITFIDYAYNFGTKVIFLAEVPVEKLYQGYTNRFEFKRTISRIQSM